MENKYYKQKDSNYVIYIKELTDAYIKYSTAQYSLGDNEIYAKTTPLTKEDFEGGEEFSDSIYNWWMSEIDDLEEIDRTTYQNIRSIASNLETEIQMLKIRFLKEE